MKCPECGGENIEQVADCEDVFSCEDCGLAGTMGTFMTRYRGVKLSSES